MIDTPFPSFPFQYSKDRLSSTKSLREDRHASAVELSLIAGWISELKDSVFEGLGVLLMGIEGIGIDAREGR